MRIAILFLLAHIIPFNFATATEQPTEKVAEAEHSKSLGRLKDGLLAQFDTTIDRMTAKGNLADVKGLTRDRELFVADDACLPTHPSMAVHRIAYETGWWDAKAKWEKALKTTVMELTKAKKFDEATRVQTALMDLADLKFMPKDVLDALVGSWRISMVGQTRNGSAINYQASWVFDKSGVVKSVEAKAEGKWIYEYKARRILIVWENAEKSRESFPVPLLTSGVTGQSWHGPKVKLTAEKELVK